MRFKKSIALTIAFLMLVSNAGFAMTVHYCGGKISSISSGFSNKETCEMPKAKAEKPCCAKKAVSKTTDKDVKKHKKCCSDKTVNLKGKTIDVIVKAASSDFMIPFVVPAFQTQSFQFADAAPATQTFTYYCDANAPPLFKLYHQYILYA